MNTERLCNDLIDDNEHEFSKECTVDDTILLDMSVYEGLSVPEMTLENLMKTIISLVLMFLEY